MFAVKHRSCEIFEGNAWESSKSNITKNPLPLFMKKHQSRGLRSLATLGCFTVTFLFATLFEGEFLLRNLRIETKISENSPASKSFPRLWEQADSNDVNHIHRPRKIAYEYDLPWMSNITENGSNRHGSTTSECKPHSDWQEKSFPTCNTIHEIDFPSGIRRSSRKNQTDEEDGLLIYHLSEGASRQGWMVHMDRRYVFKSLRWKKDYQQTMFEHQRKDALSTERLTSSNHIIDIYGFCGEAAINQFADGGELIHYITKDLSSSQRLIFARDAALGLADIHEIGGKATVAHHDIKPYNMLVVGGKLKFHDFNNAQFLRVGRKKNGQDCGFSFRNNCDTKISQEIEPPQECLSTNLTFTEKFEVYRLGLIFYFILVGENPGKIMVPPAMTEHVVLTNPPKLPNNLRNSGDPAIEAIIDAMNDAFTFNPEKRPSARSIADTLAQEASEILGPLEVRL